MNNRALKHGLRRFLIFAVSALAVAAVLAAQSGTVSIPMTATFRDNLVEPPDRILSDGKGAYVDGVDQVKAVLDAAGDFDLDTAVQERKQVRALFLDLRAPASADATPPFETAFKDVYASTGVGGLPNLAVGASTRSSYRLNFSVNGVQHFLRFNPSTYPDTSSVLITRVSADTWTVEAAPTDIAKLLSVTTVKGKSVLVDEGNFFMPFKIFAKQK